MFAALPQEGIAMGFEGFDNRELSWLKFNQRVLEEACSPESPLLERLKFTAIFQSNLDEFFRVRVGSLYDQHAEGPDKQDSRSGMTAKEQLKAIFQRVRELEPQRDNAYVEIMQALGAYGVMQVTYPTATDEERRYLDTYFKKEIRPLIVPLVVDKDHPFPFLKNQEIYAVLHLESKSGVRLGIIPVNEQFKRVIPLGENGRRFILAEDLILSLSPAIFKTYKVIDRTLLRITRSADIAITDAFYDYTNDFRQIMEELIKQRSKLMPVRIQLSNSFSQPATDFLRKQLGIKNSQIFPAKAPLDLSFVYGLQDVLQEDSLLYPKRVPQKSPQVSETRPMLAQIKKQDILLHYPYDSIRPFLRLLQEAAEDESVLSIKITLYRVARNSQVIDALCRAAENGIRVLVLVELRARFDEENNIGWSKRLQRAGCEVIYGSRAFKVHSKLLLITRKSRTGVHYITQIGTGNYNEKTSLLYTDLSLMTANQAIGAEAEAVFDALCADTQIEENGMLLVAPHTLRNQVLRMMDEEIQRAAQGLDSYIGLKLNSISDKVIIEKLMEASAAGVHVDLIVRGICCVIGGIPGKTEHIHVRSIVGRYLEHSRIYIFGTPDRARVYMGSADYMPRNTIHRVEVAVPLLDPAVRARVLHIFDVYLRDNCKARLQQPDGTYVLTAPEEGEPLRNAQEQLFDEAYAAAKKKSPRKKPAAKPEDAPAETPKRRGRKPAAKPEDAPAEAPKRRGRKPAPKPEDAPAETPKKEEPEN